MRARLPENELARLKKLYELAILDTDKEQSFDDLTHIAAHICSVPTAVVSLVDVDRQWFKSCVGLDASETPRDVAFCAHAILQPDDVFVVEDATQHPTFMDNGLVTGAPYIRFYAGAPLVTDDGYALGTLCVIDYVPRQLSEEQLFSLKALARQVVQLLRLKASGQLIQQQSERLTSIIEGTNAGTWEWDIKTGLVLFNQRCIEMLGYSAEEMQSINIEEWAKLIHPDDVLGRYKQIAQHLSGKVNFYEKEFRMRKKNGEWLWLYSRGKISSYSDDHQALIMSGMHLDISEQKRIEQMKTELISTVSHELRTPLTSISGALSLVTNNMMGELPEKVKTILLIAHKNSQRLALIINDLLDMEKLLAGKMHFDCKDYNVASIVEQAITENKLFADKYSVSFQLNNQAPDSKIYVDIFRYQQVLNNFLSNAAKFSPQNASVDVFIQKIENKIRVSVRDYGIGMPEEFKSRIFQKFSQADTSDSRQKGGTGLGLAISKELVERMRGTISFESKENEGSCFYTEFDAVNE